MHTHNKQNNTPAQSLGLSVTDTNSKPGALFGGGVASMGEHLPHRSRWGSTASTAPSWRSRPGPLSPPPPATGERSDRQDGLEQLFRWPVWPSPTAGVNASEGESSVAHLGHILLFRFFPSAVTGFDVLLRRRPRGLLVCVGGGGCPGGGLSQEPVFSAFCCQIDAQKPLWQKGHPTLFFISPKKSVWAWKRSLENFFRGILMIWVMPGLTDTFLFMFWTFIYCLLILRCVPFSFPKLYCIALTGFPPRKQLLNQRCESFQVWRIKQFFFFFSFMCC